MNFDMSDPTEKEFAVAMAGAKTDDELLSLTLYLEQYRELYKASPPRGEERLDGLRG